MGISLTAYIQQLEFIAFFAGYPLLFLLVWVGAEAVQNRTSFIHQLKNLLPTGYALTGSLFTVHVIVNMVAEYRFSQQLHLPENIWLTVWALVSLVFWIPQMRTRPMLAPLHSLPFFFLFGREIVLYISGKSDPDTLATYMKLYSISMGINAGCLLLCGLALIVGRRFFGRKPSPQQNGS